jgi:AraC-like DNA-binding protein
MDVKLEASSVLVVNLDAALLRDTADALAGGESPISLSAIPVLSFGTPAGRRFWHELGLFWRDLRYQDTSLMSSDLVRQRRSDLSAALIEMMQPPDLAPLTNCGRKALNRAEEFIMVNIGEPISRTDICKAAGVSERQLTRVFHARHGMGPVKFLRHRRLEAAQRFFLAGDASELTVTSIATACGINHLGRFSMDYARMFGESPLQSLSR